MLGFLVAATLTPFRRIFAPILLRNALLWLRSIDFFYLQALFWVSSKGLTVKMMVVLFSLELRRANSLPRHGLLLSFQGKSSTFFHA
jgi:hypothetical protein